MTFTKPEKEILVSMLKKKIKSTQYVVDTIPMKTIKIDFLKMRLDLLKDILEKLEK